MNGDHRDLHVRKHSFPTRRSSDLFTWGMVIAHLGIAVSLAGMASDAAFTKETLVAARVGEPHRVGPFSVTLEGIRPVVGDNWSALEAKLVARRGEGAPIVQIGRAHV